MQFSTLLVVSTSLVSSVFAIGFTQVPASVTAGVPTIIKWSGADDSAPVSITLKKGNPKNLQTVSLLTGDATGDSFTWTPPKTLPDGDDYALSISQGEDDINYSGEFPLTGGAPAAATTGLVTVTAAASTTVFLNSTTVYVASATGASLAIPRNTTFSIQTLSATGGGISAGVPTTTAAQTTVATTSSPSATPTKNAAIRAGSPLAFVLSAFAAILFWA